MSEGEKGHSSEQVIFKKKEVSKQMKLKFLKIIFFKKNTCEMWNKEVLEIKK